MQTEFSVAEAVERLELEQKFGYFCVRIARASARLDQMYAEQRMTWSDVANLMAACKCLDMVVPDI